MPSAESTDGEPRAASETLLQWRVHLAVRQPRRALALLLIVAAAAALAYAAFGHPLWSLLTAIALLASVSDFAFPVTYRLTTDGVARHSGVGRSFLAWGNVRRCYPDAEGVKLSPLPAPSRLEAFRGIYLRYPDDPEARSRLLETLRVRCPDEVEVPHDAE